MVEIYSTSLSLTNTPVERHTLPSGRVVSVKREDLCSPHPGPQFSKIRGVYSHLAPRPEEVVGVLDTFHSKAGWAVAQCCKALGKQCIDFFPVYNSDKDGNSLKLRHAQEMVLQHGGILQPLPAGRSAILYHRAKKELAKIALGRGLSYFMIANALKLQESVEETVLEVERTQGDWDNWVVPSSSGTIAAGVIKGLLKSKREPTVWVHLGYTRPESAVIAYLEKASGGCKNIDVRIVDEGYAYKDSVSIKTPFPCNPFYDAKSWLWLDKVDIKGSVLFWNIGA